SQLRLSSRRKANYLAAVPRSYLFQDRADAGRQLAEQLLSYAGRDDVIVLALPRGGVPVAFAVAQRLGVPLDVFIVRKLGVPFHEELAMGAIASGGVRVLNEDVVQYLGLSDEDIDPVAQKELEELNRRERAYRHGRPPMELRGRIVILVDDGLATGSTMRAAVAAVRSLEPERVIVAVPVAAQESCATLKEDADEVFCLRTPDNFQAVGLWYRDFGQTSDDEVRALLDQA